VFYQVLSRMDLEALATLQDTPLRNA